MAFINDWETKLNASYAAFATIAEDAREIDFKYGLLPAAVLWPVSQDLKVYKPEAIQALQQIVGVDRGGSVLNAIRSWPADRLAAAQTLATESQVNPALCDALTTLVEYFNALPTFLSHLGQAVSPPSSRPAQISISEIRDGDLTVGNIISGLVSGDVFSGDKITYITNISQESEPKPHVPRRPFEPETVLVAAGAFLMGSDIDGADEAPQHQLQLPAYEIGKYPVTNREYAEFIKLDRQQEPPTKSRWFLREPPADKLDHPVTGVSWSEAKAYCDWLSEQTGQTRIYRLPTEAEWEKAARGTDGARFPWGNEWLDGRCNSNSNDTTPVLNRDAQPAARPYYPAGVSVYGCGDMIGNVQEWTSTLWGSDLKKGAFPYPYRSDDGREDLEADQHLHRVYRVQRGGAFRDSSAKLRCSARGTSSADSRSRWRGFRVVLEL
jgi:formylglycine-generating enzyme required for sulfatase activity